MGAILRPLASLTGSVVTPGSPQGWTRIQGEGNKVILTLASDALTSAVSVEVGATVQEPGEAVFETGLLVRSLPLSLSSSVELSTDDEMVKIDDILTHPTLRDIPVGLDRVTIPEGAVSLGTVPIKALLSAVRAAAKVPSSGRSGSDSVQIKAEVTDDGKDSIRVVATDTYLLFDDHIPSLSKTTSPGQFALLPRTFLKGVVALLSQIVGEQVELLTHNEHLYIKSGSLVAFVRGTAGSDFAIMADGLELTEHASVIIAAEAWKKILSAVEMAGEHLAISVTSDRVCVWSEGVGRSHLEQTQFSLQIPFEYLQRFRGDGELRLNATYATNCHSITLAASSSTQEEEEEEEKGVDRPISISLSTTRRGGNIMVMQNPAHPFRTVYLAGLVK